jgi:hypothetical protein
MPPCGGAAGPSNVRQNAKIVIGATLMHCVIRDLSHSGAGIVVENPEALPKDFHLYYVADRLRVRSAQLRWYKNGSAGVSFR